MTDRHRLIAVLLAPVVCCVLASSATAAAHHGVPTPIGVDASATLTACTSGATAAERTASFSATMQALPGTSTMSVDFELYERTATSPYASVSAPGFGVWQDSNRGIASFTANENVVDLPAPAAFRAVVHYRWLSRHGRVIRRDEHVTPVCMITAPQPNLAIARITHAPGTPPKTTEIYDVVVRNDGAGAVGSFAVAFSVGEAALPDQIVTSLAPASTTTVQFTGPRCTVGTTITAVVDPTDAITEPANPSRTVSIICDGTSASGDTGEAGASSASSSTSDTDSSTAAGGS
jgi:hypothetical protein